MLIEVLLLASQILIPDPCVGSVKVTKKETSRDTVQNKASIEFELTVETCNSGCRNPKVFAKYEVRWRYKDGTQWVDPHGFVSAAWGTRCDEVEPDTVTELKSDVVNPTRSEVRMVQVLVEDVTCSCKASTQED